MCLGVPARVVSVQENPLGVLVGEVSFGGGVRREVCLALTPDVQVGEYVIVHVGFAISRLREEEAQQVLQAWNELEALAEEQGEPITVTFE